MQTRSDAATPATTIAGPSDTSVAPEPSARCQRYRSPSCASACDTGNVTLAPSARPHARVAPRAPARWRRGSRPGRTARRSGRRAPCWRCRTARRRCRSPRPPRAPPRCRRSRPTRERDGRRAGLGATRHPAPAASGTAASAAPASHRRAPTRMPRAGPVSRAPPSRRPAHPTSPRDRGRSCRRRPAGGPDHRALLGRRRRGRPGCASTCRGVRARVASSCVGAGLGCASTERTARARVASASSSSVAVRSDARFGTSMVVAA